MGHLGVLVIAVCAYLIAPLDAGETILSTILTPDAKKLTVSPQKFTLQRQARSYYDQRFGPRPLSERLEYDRPARCGRCDERYDDRDYDRRYDDERRRPTYGNRYDRNRDDEDRFDRRNERKNGTEESDEEKKPLDDKDDRRMGNRGSNRDRNRYDDRDRYRPDYYDRFLRPYDDPYRDPYRERRPYQRDPYDRYDEAYGGRYDQGYRRQVYDDRFDRGNGYDDTGYGSYSPGLGRGPHDSFRPWDETYRGQSGWDDGGRGYYFAGGRPEAGAGGWKQPANDYYGGYRDRDSTSGWQDVGYGRRGYQGYQDPYAQRPTGWHSVGERRPYRDQSGVNQMDYNRGDYQGVNRQPTRDSTVYGQSYGQPAQHGQTYGQQPQSTYGQGTYGTANRGTNQPTSSSTTPGNSYLYERDDDHVTAKESADSSTKTPS